MLCTRCNQREANVYFSQSINGQSEEHSLCGQCAEELGILGGNMGFMGFGEAFSPSDFISSLFGEFKQAQPVTRQIEPQCASCGMTYTEFGKTGRFGCPNCYEAFGEQLPQVLKRIHGSDEHVGKLPAKEIEQEEKLSELEQLRMKLKEAIAAEEYEKAAEIRDEIKKREGSQE